MKQFIGYALCTIGALALSQMGPRRLMDPVARMAPNPNRNDDEVKEYFFETDVDHFDNRGHSDKFKMRYLV